MPITWDEARKLNTDLEAKQAYDAMPFHVGDRARVNDGYHDDRLWGDVVMITGEPFDMDGNAAIMAKHPTYGRGESWVFFVSELEPLGGAGA